MSTYVLAFVHGFRHKIIGGGTDRRSCGQTSRGRTSGGDLERYRQVLVEPAVFAEFYRVSVLALTVQ